MKDQSQDTLEQERVAFHDDVKGLLGELGLLPSRCMKELEFAAQKYNTNVLHEARSVTDARLLKDLAETIELSDERIGRRTGIWSKDLVAIFCNEAPGHNAVMSYYHPKDDRGGDQTNRYLHLSGPLVAESLENMQRHGANSSKLAQIKFQSAIDSCLPAKVDEDLAKKLCGAVLDCDSAKDMTPREHSMVPKAVVEYLIRLGTIEDQVSRQTMLTQSAALTGVERRNLIDLMLVQFLQAWREEPHANDGVLRTFVIEFISSALASAPGALRRAIIGSIAALCPTHFRRGLVELRSRIRDQYGGHGDEHGRSRSTWLWRSGHAKWMLISDVLDVVWAPSKGPLGEDVRRPAPDLVVYIVYHTHAYALHLIRLMQGDAAAKRASSAVNIDHMKLVSRWRWQIYELQRAILLLDPAILQAERAILDPNRPKDEQQQARANEKRLRGQLEQIQAWRRELERMLRQADYEKGKKGSAKIRPAGPKIRLPEFHLAWRTLPPSEKLTAIATAAVEHKFVVSQ